MKFLKRYEPLDPSATLIAASGLMENGVLSKLSALGVQHFVQKPYLPVELLQTIREAIDARD